MTAGRRVLAVVSAIGSGTDELVARADTVARDIELESPAAQAAYAALLGTGESVSAALAGLALDRRGLDFTILDAGRGGPFTRGPQLDAQPHALDTSGVKRALTEHDPALRSRAKPRRFAALDWDSALRLQDAILQHKAAQFAFRHRVVFEVGACGGDAGTMVGAAESRFAPPSPAARGRALAAERRLAS